MSFSDFVRDLLVLEPEPVTIDPDAVFRAKLLAAMPAVFPQKAETKHEVIVYEPASLEEGCRLADEIRSGRTVIVNLEHTESNLARKIREFLTGAVYALGGSVHKVTEGVIIFIPSAENNKAHTA